MVIIHVLAVFGADIYKGPVDTHRCREWTFCGHFEIELPECRGTWIQDAPPQDLFDAGWNWSVTVAEAVEEVMIDDQGAETWIMRTYVYKTPCEAHWGQFEIFISAKYCLFNFFEASKKDGPLRISKRAGIYNAKAHDVMKKLSCCKCGGAVVLWGTVKHNVQCY